MKSFFPLKKAFSLGFLIWAACAAYPVAAQTALDRYFAGLKTLTADFEQTVRNPQMKAAATSHGTLALDRPGKFVWDYKTPYVQRIVSDGNRIWIHDIDLEQVTIKRLDAALGNTPGLLLSSDKPLVESFNITELSAENDVSVVQLEPKDKDAGFTQVKLRFVLNELASMELTDNLGQSTKLIFINVKRNPKVDASVFEFKVPKGVDIFDASKEE